MNKDNKLPLFNIQIKFMNDETKTGEGDDAQYQCHVLHFHSPRKQIVIVLIIIL